MTKRTLGYVVLCVSLLVGASLQAHHSLAGVYDLGKESKVSGTFKAFHLVNPHSSMKIQAKGADGKMVEWTFIGGSVGQISRFGLKDEKNPNFLKVGDEIIVTIVPAIDRKNPVGLLSAITYKDGHTLRFRSPDE